MHRGILELCLSMIVLICAAGAWAAPDTLPAPSDVSAKAVSAWLRWVIPLPQEAQIPKSLTVPTAAIKLTARAGAGELEKNALRQLQDLFRAQAGVDGNPDGAFEIMLGVCDAQGQIGDLTVPDAARLAELPNKEQAYLIRPVGDNRLVLAALDERGVFYAVLTLCQLLEPKFGGETVTLPLAVITDWPDLAERGEWGIIRKGDITIKPEDIEWLAARKMNLIEFHSTLEFDAQGHPKTRINRTFLRRGRRHAVKMVPTIGHLDQLGETGIYQHYPELRGKGDGAWSWGVSKIEKTYAPCASNSKLYEVLAGWMRSYAEYGVRDISCWLGEIDRQCQCPECAKMGQFALEARAFVQAWRLAVKDYPDLRIRILLSQGSYKSNDKVLAEIPPEVGITYYDGYKTYDPSPNPMIYPLLEEYAARGGRLGVYPILTPSYRIISPWTAPQFVKARMTEFVDKKLTSFAAYVIGGNALFDFNVTAAAEWGWNARGRSEREFALAWAMRQGMRADQAELAADWAVQLGQVAWDLYGARLIQLYLFRPATLAGMISSGMTPAYGKGLLEYIPDAQHLERNLKSCRAALNIAERIGTPGILAESRAILTYYRMLDEITGSAGFLAAHDEIGEPERLALQERMNRLALAGMLNTDALRDWERAVRVGVGGRRFLDCVQATYDSVAAVARALSRHGVRDAAAMFAPTEVGGWTAAEFAEQPEIGKTMEVTRQITGPGSYVATFRYTDGRSGLRITRAALLEMTGTDTGQRVELAADQHEGTAGAVPVNNEYQLELTNYNTPARYFLAATVRGARPRDQAAGQAGCEGKVYFERERPLDWQTLVVAVQPDPAAVVRKTGFSGKGLKVGILSGGLGGDGILEFLRDAEKIDAAPVNMSNFKSRQCRVLIIPQPLFEVSAAFTQAVEEFIRQGGGVIATHDAVGYRAMPKLCEPVCAGGVEHTRAGSWKTSGTHPVNWGLPVDTALSRGYYDQVELQAGTNGTVVASGETTGQPVAVAGEFGGGRYVACGLLLGMEHDQFGSGSKEAPPTPDEARLLLNAIRWCAGGK